MVIIGGRLSSWVSDLADQSNQLPEKGPTSQPIGEHAYCEDCDDGYTDYDDHYDDDDHYEDDHYKMMTMVALQ